MQKTQSSTLKLTVIFFFAAILASCTNSSKYDCPQNYCGWIIAKQYPTVIQNGCEFKKIELIDVWRYEVGDTLCKPNYMDRHEKSMRELDSIIAKMN